MLQHAGFGLGEGGIAGIHIVGDGLGGDHEIGELLVCGDQIGIVVVVAVAVGVGVVGLRIVIGLLAEEVDRISEVGAPAVDEDGSLAGLAHFVGEGGDVGVGLEHHVLAAQALGKDVLQDLSGLSGHVAVALDVVVHGHGEGDALGGQLFDGLGLALSGLLGIHTGILGVVVLEAQLVPDQLGVVGAVRGEGHAIAGVAEVLAGQGVDGVGAGEVVGEIQAVVQALAEVLVGNGGVPVGIGGLAILQVLAVHQVDLVGVLGGTGFHQVGLQFAIAGAFVDALQGGLVQGHVIELTVLEQLEGHGSGLDHLHGDGVEALAVGVVPVVGALGEHLLVLIHEVGHGVGTAVPHVFPGDVTVAVHAHFLDQLSGEGIEAVVGGHRGEVGELVDQGVGDGAGGVIGGDTDHLGELAALVGGESLGGFGTVGLGQSLGVLIVVVGTGDHLGGHGHVVGVVLGVVEDPLQTGGPVGSEHVSLDFAVLVEPGHALVQGEDPGLAAVGRLIALRGVQLQVAVVVVGQKTVDQVAQHVQVGRGLGIVDIPGFQLTGLGLVGVQILQLIGAGGGHAHRGQQSENENQRKQFLHSFFPPVFVSDIGTFFRMEKNAPNITTHIIQGG